MNGLTLAYIGDAYYELKIRKYLIDQKLTSVNDLHKKAILFTKGLAQAEIVMYMIENELLSIDEKTYFKRGRNASGPGRKNIDAKTYHRATGFEALIGYLYLNDKKRCDELIHIAIKYIEGENHGKSGGQKIK